MHNKRFSLIVAQRFSEDLEAVVNAVNEELSSAPEIAKELTLLKTQSAWMAEHYAKNEHHLGECGVKRPTILVVTGAVFEDDAYGGRKIGSAMAKRQIPVWMFSNMCEWSEGIERIFPKYFESNSPIVAARKVARAAIAYFKERLQIDEEWAS